MYEIRSIVKTKHFGIVSYGCYDTEWQAKRKLLDLSVTNYANAKEIREHGLELVRYDPVVVSRITPQEMS